MLVDFSLGPAWKRETGTAARDLSPLVGGNVNFERIFGHIMELEVDLSCLLILNKLILMRYADLGEKCLQNRVKSG